MSGFFKTILESVQFLVSLVRAAVRSLRDNKGLAVVSVALAFGIWIVVTNADNPTRSTVVNADIPVEPVNVPDGIAVVKPVPAVRVRVAIADSELQSLTPADFEATVDVQNHQPGDYQETVAVRPLTSRGGLRVEQVLPEKITIRLAQLVSKQVPVNIDVQGEAVSGYTLSTPEIKDESVTVSGPQDDVDKVSQVTGAIDVTGKTDTIDQAVRLSARDASGNLVPGVDLNVDLTNVTIDIAQQTFTRAMVVSPAITTSPADGYNVVSVQANPQTVTVRGDEAYINGTSFIATKPIDITGATTDVVKTVALDLPTGAEVTGSAAVVTVTIKIEPVIGDFNFIVPVAVRNLGSDVAISGALPTVTITLHGPKPVLEALSPNDISATINLDGKSAGVSNVKVDVAAPNGLTVAAVTPSEVDLTLVKR